MSGVTDAHVSPLRAHRWWRVSPPAGMLRFAVTVRTPLWSSSWLNSSVTLRADSSRAASDPHGSSAVPVPTANATHVPVPFRLAPKRRSWNEAPSGTEMIRSLTLTAPVGSSGRSPRMCGSSPPQAPRLTPQNHSINRNRGARLATILEWVNTGSARIT